MAVTTTNSVADYFICFAHEVGDPITNLKLQKLVYYAHAWHLALHGTPLVPDRFQAWVHGPVCHPLYQRFKRYGWNPISESVDPPVLPEGVEAHLREVMEVYGGYSAWDLERLTHAEGSLAEGPRRRPGRRAVQQPDFGRGDAPLLRRPGGGVGRWREYGLVHVP